MSDKRSLRIEKVPASTLVKIAWNGGGEVPAELSGTYTSYHSANMAIEVWKSNNKREEVEIDSPDPDEDKERIKRRGRPPIKPIGA